MLLSQKTTTLSIRCLALALLSIVVCPIRVSRAWTCESSCGGIPLNYPFGSGWDCGSPAYQPFVNCTRNKLLFYTPGGTYTVQSIDYINNVMIVVDSQMSTCSAMGLSRSVGLPIGSPFYFASYDTVAVMGCSSTSSLYSKGSCDASMQQVCSSLYGCEGIKQIGISPGSSASSSCCVLSSSVLATPPYQINLPLLQCATYSSIYYIGSMGNPQSSWLYGIALRFNPGSTQPPPSSSGQNPTCYVCQEAEEAKASVHAIPSIPAWVAGLLTLMEAALFLI